MALCFSIYVNILLLSYRGLSAWSASETLGKGGEQSMGG